MFCTSSTAVGEPITMASYFILLSAFHFLRKQLRIESISIPAYQPIWATATTTVSDINHRVINSLNSNQERSTLKSECVGAVEMDTRRTTTPHLFRYENYINNCHVPSENTSAEIQSFCRTVAVILTNHREVTNTGGQLRLPTWKGELTERSTSMIAVAQAAITTVVITITQTMMDILQLLPSMKNGKNMPIMSTMPKQGWDLPC